MSLDKRVIAVDTLGGDSHIIGLDGKKVEQPIVKRTVHGALRAAAENKNIDLVLIGDPDQITKAQAESEHAAPARIIPAKDYFALDDQQNSSLYLLLDGIGRDFDGGITIGDTTKIIQHIREKLHDIEIPGTKFLPLANNLPVRNREKPVLHLDLGANPQCRDIHLYKFAQMARIYLEKINNIQRPRIGILTIGAEDYKGNALVRRTIALCEAAGLDVLNFARAEPRDVELSKVDAIVMDGFTGNVVLKAVEAKSETVLLNTQDISKKIAGSMVQKYMPAVQALEGLIADVKNTNPEALEKYKGQIEKLLQVPGDFDNMAKGILGELLQLYTAGAYGAASLFGLRSRAPGREAVLKKGHGVSDARAIYNGVLECAKEIEARITQAMEQYFKHEFYVPELKKE